MPENGTHLQKASEELISSEVQEMIGHRPGWMIRNGNTLFLIVLASLVSLCWLIRYPDTVSGSARLVALNAPKMINARSEGKLIRLFVASEEWVNKGRHLGYMESTSDYEEVMRLRNWIQRTVAMAQGNMDDVFVKDPLPSLFNLGGLQSAYQDFQGRYLETKQSFANGYSQMRMTGLQKDLEYLRSLKANAFRQQKLLEQDRQLQKKEYDAYESLAREKVIAPLELNQYKSRLLSKQQNLAQANKEITNSDMAIHGKGKEISDLRKSILDRQQEFHSSILGLKSRLEEWIAQYVLIAPEDGRLVFISPLQENEWIAAGQNLFYLEPRQTLFYGELRLPQKGFGKIKRGQNVIIRLESYPSDEYGYLKGLVNYIADIPGRGDSFLVRVTLPRGLRTSDGRELFFHYNLSGQAEIITDERRLFDRFAGRLKQVSEK
jgi:hypothetical protein